jgi:hypothetical protein
MMKQNGNSPSIIISIGMFLLYFSQAKNDVLKIVSFNYISCNQKKVLRISKIT